MVEDVNDMEALMQLKLNGGNDQINLNPSVVEVKDTCMWNPLHFAVY